MIHAARYYTGQEAIYHQHYSPVCWQTPDTQPLCLEYGLGRDQFDCSGLVLRALADVLGSPEVAPKPQLRHVRQMWQDAQESRQLFEPGKQTPGSLVIFERRWDTPEGVRRVAGHIAIMTEVNADEAYMIHAQPSAALVVEHPLDNPDRILGYLDLKGVD